MSAQIPPSDSSDSSHPAHGHPDSTLVSGQTAYKTSTASHPPASQPDPTLTTSSTSSSSAARNDHDGSSAEHGTQGRLSATAASGAAQLADLKVKLKGALRQYPDFPSPGILFEDILPIFADPTLHASLIEALELQVVQSCAPGEKPDVIVGLEARGFLFGPSLAIRLGAGFVPVRKQGKLPGETVTAEYQKEYGSDFFQIQSDSIKPGQRVLIVDDIIATGGSAAAAGNLVKKIGGTLLGYVFMMELDFLKGREKLDAPVYTLLSSQ